MGGLGAPPSPTDGEMQDALARLGRLEQEARAHDEQTRHALDVLRIQHARMSKRIDEAAQAAEAARAFAEHAAACADGASHALRAHTQEAHDTFRAPSDSLLEWKEAITREHEALTRALEKRESDIRALREEKAGRLAIVEAEEQARARAQFRMSVVPWIVALATLTWHVVGYIARHP